ncbi:MAG: type II secretion system minor pseudopilin GspI [Ectothiorhodospira sp.]
MRRVAHHPRQRGFTLLEVLVAVAVLAVALGAAIKAGSENARNAAYLRDRTHAHWVAQNVLARYRAGLENATPGTREGAEFMAGREWYWRARIQPRELDVAEYTLGPVPRVEVTVRDRDDPDASPLARSTTYLTP